MPTNEGWTEDGYPKAIELMGRIYVPERTCRNIHPDVFQCSECYAIDEDWKHPHFCHGCGAKVVSE